MKCIKCHNTLHTETGGFSMTINGKTIKVINAPVLHCKKCNSVIISDEVKWLLITRKNTRNFICRRTSPEL